MREYEKIEECMRLLSEIIEMRMVLAELKIQYDCWWLHKETCEE